MVWELYNNENNSNNTYIWNDGRINNERYKIQNNRNLASGGIHREWRKYTIRAVAF